MSKYEEFLIMKTYEFLIIIGFIQTVFTCNQDATINITDDLYSVCPVQWFRRKRAYTDYTRWRSDQEVTDEFLVKVLDEDLTSPVTKPIIAVNILPATKGGEKIIVGGVNIPAPTTLMSITNDLREYTRFVPPTAATVGEIYVPPVTLTSVGSTTGHSLEPQGYYSERDDSPPASPQFIARSPALVARQYAPIEPVAFSRRTTIGPLTPPTTTTLNSFHPFSSPTRTKPQPVIKLPVRTTNQFQDFRFQPFDEELNTPESRTRTTFAHLERTTEFSTTPALDLDGEYIPTTKKDIDDSRRRNEEIKQGAEKDTDVYNMMFYNDDDIASSKKEEQEGIDSDYYKKGLDSDAPEPDFSDVKQTNEDKGVIAKELQNYIDEYVIDNITGKALSKGVFGIPEIELATINARTDKPRDKRRPFCNLLKLRQLNFNSPRTLPEIVNQLKIWAEDSPVAKWVDITDGNYTTMENPIYMMIVDDPSSGQIVTAKQTVMIVAGIQGRDHHAVAAAMYVLYQLIERSEGHSDLLTKYRFWIIPVFNPDGYDYSMTFPHRREWTKNLRQQWDTCKGRESCKACETHGLRCTIQPCYGVNLDRNFEYQWIPAEELKAEHPCGGLYAGARQLSEAETRAFTRYLFDQHTPLFTFIAFKEGDVLGVMYPYSHTRKKRAFDQIYRQRASRAASAAYSISNRPYVAGQTSEFLPLYAGGIEDWIDGHLGIDNTYTIMMFRPSDSYSAKLITERAVHETYAAMDTLLLQSLEALGPPPPVTITRAGYGHRIVPQQLIYIITLYIIILLNG